MTTFVDNSKCRMLGRKSHSHFDRGPPSAADGRHAQCVRPLQAIVTSYTNYHEIDDTGDKKWLHPVRAGSLRGDHTRLVVAIYVHCQRLSSARRSTRRWRWRARRIRQQRLPKFLITLMTHQCGVEMAGVCIPCGLAVIRVTRREKGWRAVS